MQYQWLLNRAAAARAHAYCPYSGFAVGAALLAASGAVYTGCNVESASFGATICAERNALTTAVGAGERAFTPPCGICRQLLAEFGDMTVLYADAALTAVRETTLSALLPDGFVLTPPTSAKG